MSVYARVKRRFWNDEKVQALSPEARYLMLYLLTSPHGNFLGLFVLRHGYAIEDLGWDSKRFAERFGELLDKGLVNHDPTTNLVFIPNWLKHNPLENPNQVKAALKIVEELPTSALWIQAAQAVDRFCKPFAKPLSERLRQGYAKPVTVTETVTVTEDLVNASRASSTVASTVLPTVPERFDGQGTDSATDATGGVPGDPRAGNPEDSQPKRQRRKREVFGEGTLAYELARFLREQILSQDPTTKVPGESPEELAAWSLEADRMIRLDERDPDEAKALMRWAQNDPFWRANILSMAKFRQKYDTLKRQWERSAKQARRETALDRRLREGGILR